MMNLKNDSSAGRRVSIDDLPDEVLIKILSYSKISEILSVIQHVCTRWKKLSQDAEVWFNKGYTIKPRMVDDEVVTALQQMPHLYSIKMERPVDPEVIRSLYNCRHLNELVIHFAQMLDCLMVENLVEHCPEIKSLTFPSDCLTEERIAQAVSKLSQLNRLTLVGDSDPPSGLRALANGCPKLHSLDLDYNHYFAEDLEYFFSAKKDNLQHITLRWSTRQNSCVVPLLAVCASTLQFLRLTCNEEEFVGEHDIFSKLHCLPNLRELIISAMDSSLPGSPSLAFKSGALSHLEKLDMTFSELTNDTVVTVCVCCPKLRVLLLGENYLITDEALKEIHCLSQLKTLSLSRCRSLGSAAISYIAQLPALETLVLDHLNLEQFRGTLDHMLTMTSLRCLSLDACTIPVDPFDRFPGNLVNLRYVYMQCCFPDDSVMKKLQNQMPELKICKKPLDCRFYNPCEILRVKMWD